MVIILFLLFIWNLWLTFFVLTRYKKNSISKVVSSDLSNSNIKVGFHRFNAFPDSTGEQSFTVSFTDLHQNGILLTALHTKTGTRVYAKSIELGKVEKGSLSETEKLAILNPITTN